MLGILATVAMVPMLSAAVRLESSVICPKPGRVNQKLARLLPATPGPLHVARVDGTSTTLVLELATEDGTVLARKELPRRGTCEELARVAAVVIAAWEARFREGTLALPEAEPPVPSPPPVADPPPSSAASSPVVAPPSSAAPPPVVAPPLAASSPPAVSSPPTASPPPPNELEPPAEEPPPSASPLRIRGDLGAVAGFSARWSFGGLVRGSIGGERWSAVALALIETPRELTLEEGGVRWNRPLLGAGVRWSLRREGPRLELEGGAAVAWLRLRGSGFTQSSAASDVDPAAWAGATLSWRAGPLRPFVGALGLLWLRQQSARVRIVTTSSEESATRDLPRGEAMAVLGLSFPGG